MHVARLERAEPKTLQPRRLGDRVEQLGQPFRLGMRLFSS
jgi:hypothetical protein